MNLNAWRQRLLIAIGLILLAVPWIGLPLLIKNIIFTVGGLIIVGLILSLHDTHKHENLMPSVYQEPLPEKYIEPPMPAPRPVDSLVPSPIKPKIIRKRRVKTTSIAPSGDYESN